MTFLKRLFWFLLRVPACGKCGTALGWTDDIVVEGGATKHDTYRYCPRCGWRA